MKYRRLDANGDHLFGSGSQGILSDTDAVAQAIQTTLGLYEGEWWENISIGLPLWQKILSSPSAKTSIINTILQNAILGVTGVTGISNIVSSFNPIKRAYSFSANTSTEYGTTVNATTSTS